MTRTLNIEKQKLDAAEAILSVLRERCIYSCEAFHYGAEENDFMAIRNRQIKNLSLEKLHAILGRLTPDSS